MLLLCVPMALIIAGSVGGSLLMRRSRAPPIDPCQRWGLRPISKAVCRATLELCRAAGGSPWRHSAGVDVRFGDPCNREQRTDVGR